jgi:hypothetical protein
VRVRFAVLAETGSTRFADKVGQEPQMRRPRPSPRQITQAEEAMLWLRWLEPEDGGRWQYGLAVIVWKLNGKRVPSKRSKAFVVSKAAL